MLRREQGGKAGLPKKGSMGPSTLERSNHSLYLSHSRKRSVARQRAKICGPGIAMGVP